jgi:hypothetical protein
MYIFLATLLVLSTSFGSHAQQTAATERDRIISRCGQYFGPTLDKDLNLFEANTFYVLQVKFEAGGRLQELGIYPKYFYSESHPEWEENGNVEYLSWAQSQNFVTRLDLIKPKGDLVSPPPSIGFVTNRTSWRTSVFTNASLTLGVLVDIAEPDNAPVRLKWIKVAYGKNPNNPQINIDWEKQNKIEPDRSSTVIDN